MDRGKEVIVATIEIPDEDDDDDDCEIVDIVNIHPEQVCLNVTMHIVIPVFFLF